MNHTFAFYEDPGHGWCAVKRSLVKELGIEDKISGYSYVNGGTAYIEEDRDFRLLAEAIKAKGDTYTLVRKYSDRASPIRSYHRFKELA